MTARDQRIRQLCKMSRPALARLYRSLGGLGGIHEPETWSNDDLISSVLDMEGLGLPMFTVVA